MPIKLYYESSDDKYEYNSFKEIFKKQLYYNIFKRCLRIKPYNDIVLLDCSSNNLTKLPELPKRLETLYCDYNKLTELPELPKSLIILSYSHNNLKVLPDLPKSLNYLCCSNNNLTVLPELPESLEELICSYNKLINLSELPKGLKELFCGYNQLIELPELPKSLEYLDCMYCNLTSFPKSLIECKNLCGICYQGNEIELTIQQMNYLNRLRNNRYSKKTIYDDGQNVHNSGIQKCIYDNIQILMND